jgi:type IV pilus assembly protein PilC
VEIRPTSAGAGLNMEINLGAFEKGVKLKDLSIMSRQLATMIAAGLSLLRALSILAAQTENKTLGSTLDSVRVAVEGGAALSDALARHRQVFPPLMIHMVRAGETGGFLDQALESVADTFEADVKLRSTIKSALTYPVVVLIMAVVSVVGMLIFIVPIFEKMFADLGGELPLPTHSCRGPWCGLRRFSLLEASRSPSGGSATSTRMPCAAGLIHSSCVCPSSATCSGRSRSRASPETSQP